MASSSGGDEAMADLTDAAGTSPEEIAKVMDEADAANKPAAGDEDMSARQMLSAMHKASDGTNVIKESMISYSTASIEGVTKKGDLMHAAKDMPDCLAALKKMIDAAKAKGGKKVKKWDFRTSPHELMGKTLDDTLVAFLMWARVAQEKDDQDDDDEGKTGMINVHKAFRRLDTYAEWMEDTGEDLVKTPLTAASVQKVLKVWGMQMSHSKDGMLVWWIDMGVIDPKAIRDDVSLEDSLRCFVWLAHVAMYDPKAQANGMCILENMASTGFWASMTMVPMKLGVKLDRLTMGVIPCKMKLIVILDTPRWMGIFMKIFSMFMSKKMMSRMKSYKKEWEKVPELLGGPEYVPKGFGECKGTLASDPVVDPYLVREGIEAVSLS